jgi:hypothetical protein
MELEGQPVLPRTEYIPVETKIDPDRIADAWEVANKAVLDSGYGKSENTVGESLGRILNWIQDTKIDEDLERRVDRQGARMVLKEFVDAADNLFADLSDRFLIEKDDPEYKLSWATFNQQLAADALVAYETQDKSLIQGMNLLVKMSEKLRAKHNPVFQQVSEMVHGACVQASLMKYFKDQGCLVLAPDPKDAAEVDVWDAKNGVDFFIVNPAGEVFFIDAKSRQNIGINEEEASPAQWRLYDHELEKAIAEQIKSVDYKKYEKNIIALAGRKISDDEFLAKATIYINPIQIQEDGSLGTEITKSLEGNFL